MDIPPPFDACLPVGRGEGEGGGGQDQDPLGTPSPSSPPAEGRGDFFEVCLLNYGLLSNLCYTVTEGLLREDVTLIYEKLVVFG